MKKLIQRILARKAQRIVEAHKPTIIAVTGSVGKTSTRNAITAVLGGKFRVLTNIENYNNEYGVPLTIIGAKSPGRSVIGWLQVFFAADRIVRLPSGSYPNVLVLEYGIDQPGDMAALCEIAKPDISVMTAITHVHVGNFSSFEELIKEKGMLLTMTKSDGLCVMNADDERVRGMREMTPARVVTYGFSALADVRGENYRLETREDFSFEPGEEFAEVHFDVANEDRAEVVLPNMIGIANASAALAAVAIGEHFGMPLEEIATRLRTFQPQAGRMRPIPGIKGSLILDDSYNAAPASTRAALDVLAQFTPPEGARRITVLGKMAELGRYSEAEHRAIGEQVARLAIDLLVTVNEPALDIRRGAIDAGFDESHAMHFATPEEAGRWLDFHIKKGDIILIKGSQSARMEKAVKDLMAEPEYSDQLLARQYGKWLNS